MFVEIKNCTLVENGKALRKAVQKGVEILVYDTKIDIEGIRLNGPSLGGVHLYGESMP